MFAWKDRMPFQSEAQRHYFEANKAKLEKQSVNVKEWEESSKGLKFPERAPKRKESLANCLLTRSVS